MTQTQRVGNPYRLVDGDAVVTAQKVFTRMGERLALEAESLGESVRLDAIMLESVAWQDPDDLTARAADIDRSDAVPPTTGESSTIDERDEPMTISSEFAMARIHTVEVDGATALKIAAPKLGHDIRLGPRELEWLTHQEHEIFSEWLATPFGPESDDHSHGH